MEDMEKTIPPRGHGGYDDNDFNTFKNARERKKDGRFEVGDLIMKRYKVLAELGQGGMGVVYRCLDETAGIEVALKALPPELSHNTLEMEDIKDNFQLVAKLVHQNIAISKQLEKDDSNGNYYLIMECCEGEDLRRWIKRKRKDGELKLEDVLPIIKQVADALDYAHEQKIIHRDIKPGNIMISANGKIKVLDFGLAAQIHTSMTRVSMAYHGTSGTGPYMAPEQWEGRAQDARADQYALAVMTYEMLAGHLPFESADAAVLREAVLKSKVISLENIPKTADIAIQRAMSKEPAERFETCSDFALALSGKKVKSAKKVKKSNPFKWVALVIFLAILGGGYYFLNQKSAPAAEKVEQKQLAIEEKKVKEEALTDEQLDTENASLKVELRKKIAEIKKKNYDPSQAFGQKTTDMDIAFATAQETKLLINANKQYKKAKKLADWILLNGELRADAKKLKNQAEQNRSEAEKYEPQTYANKLYSDAKNAYSQAVSLYESIKFVDAKKSFELAAKGFENTKNTAFDNKLQFLSNEAQKAEKSAKWNELKVWAGKIRPLNNALANQFDTKADTELKKIVVTKELASARKAKTAKEWQKVYDYAAAALKIDSGNDEALALKREAMVFVSIQKARQDLKAEKWESAFNFATQVLKISPNDREAQRIQRQAEENMINSDEALKKYLLRLCNSISKTDYKEKSAVKRLSKFDFKDFSQNNYSRFDAYTLLEDAITVKASLSAIRYLVERKRLSVNYRGKYTYTTPLCSAVRCNNMPVVKYLISHGADLNPYYPVDYGLPPLFYAKNLEMAKFLVAAGADLKWKDKKGKTIADYVSFDIALFLMSKGGQLTDPQSLYRKAAAGGKLEYLKKHSHEAAQVKNLMIDAATSGNLKLIKYLETLGLSFTITDEYEDTVLHAACGKKGTPELFQYLLKKSGLSIDVRNKNGTTPLARAASNGNIKMVNFLLAKGAACNTEDKSGRTPLHDASSKNHMDIVRILVRKGANVNASKTVGWCTALHAAVYDRNIACIKILLELGADPMITDKNGRTPMSLAKTDEIRALLRKNIQAKSGGPLIANNSLELISLINAGGDNTVIKLRNKTYEIKKLLSLDRSVKIIGESREGTRIVFSGDSAYISMSKSDGKILELENLTIDGSEDPHDTPLYLTSGVKCIIKNCRITSNAYNTHAVSAYDGVRLLIKDSELISNKGYETLNISKNSRVKLVNCTLSYRGNSTREAAAELSSGSLLYADRCNFFSSHSDSVYVMNGTAYFNSCRFTAPAGEYGIDNGTSGVIVFTYNCSYSGCKRLAEKESNVSSANSIPSDKAFFE